MTNPTNTTYETGTLPNGDGFMRSTSITPLLDIFGDLDTALEAFGAFMSPQVSKPRPGLLPQSIKPGDTAIITGVSMAVADLNTSIDFQIGDKTYRAHDVQLEVEDQADKAKAFWQSLETRLGLTA